MKAMRVMLLFFIVFLNPALSMADSDYRIEIRDSKWASIKKAYVEEKDEKIFVKGTVKRISQRLLDGHVDILVISPEGDNIEMGSVNYTPNILPRKGAQESLFTAKLKTTPPIGSTIAVGFHGNIKETGQMFHCGASGLLGR